jgi:prepilin-type N-terminal cleavage/methylation domain-containing protein
MKTSTPYTAGFTLVEIMIVVAILGLLAAIAMPNFVRARKTSQTNACINNLRQIDGAKQQWALEKGGNSGDVPSNDEIQPYLGRGEGGSLTKVFCPLSLPSAPMGGYTMNSVGIPPACLQYDLANHPAVFE